ncbi:UNKNOWN [Stylonychia lemnae]|uniref:Uncharacterized protein n=1 Tax=Stylonychia lemnae TaxID=5949 RepID=A0A078A9I2_STYLE|nr:UNKNOWN [Stylonychia lemnae]|eukprot:CDW78521.1 UNKNOWN [Stylonychia lemnae]
MRFLTTVLILLGLIFTSQAVKLNLKSKAVSIEKLQQSDQLRIIAQFTDCDSVCTFYVLVQNQDGNQHFKACPSILHSCNRYWECKGLQLPDLDNPCWKND